jgi:hypothetical protein
VTTPLFPENNDPIIIRQGRTGDCYLLACLDCIFNLGQEGYEAIKSIFTEDENGVTVRIKLTSQSVNLQKEKLQGKYGYDYDSEKLEDIFFLNKERLDVIDNAPKGVITNSLAVKILERLSAYYYVNMWDPNPPDASVVAHSVKLRHSETSTIFVGKFLGIDAHDIDANKINDIIKLKTIAPECPVYISMDYDKTDKYGTKHGRHSLRIDKIVPNSNSPGGYDVVLVNPWNNQGRERFVLNDIKQRNPRFCAFSTKPYQWEFTQLLLMFPEQVGQAIFADPQLFDTLREEMSQSPLGRSIIPQI